MLDNLRPGDRVRITHREFPDWRPTNATVIKLSIAHPDTSMAYQVITVRLDTQPFKVNIAGGIKDFGFEENDPNIELERIDEPRP